MKLNRLLTLATGALSFGTQLAQAAFGYTSSGGYYTVDAGSSNSFVFKVSQSSCDITSILFMGVEYQYSSQYTHINSGLGSATVSATTIGDYIKITCTTSDLSHYLVVHNGESIIYMGTYLVSEPSIGELRFIARLKSNLLTTSAFPQSYTSSGTSGAIEGSDVFGDSNGYTYSKFYSSVRFVEDQVHWISTDSGDVHATFVMPGTAYECSAGGPFFRDINSDKTSTNGAHNFYWYLNSGHAQTETYRTGCLYGPYALQFSRSGIPSKNMDTSFFGSLSITGFVPVSSRGYVSGTAYNVASTYTRTVHWYNSNAQYWAVGNSNGAYTSPAMKPGTYTMVLYKNELAVATQSVTVTAGSTTQSSIYSTEATTTPIWQIGDFDGTPAGFLNADKIERMHPSDTRMSAWNQGTFYVGSTSVANFPMAQIRTINSPNIISFSLTSSQVGAATLIVGVTFSFSGGRPQVTVNGSWTGPAPAAPTNLNSRGFTRGTWRGYNIQYSVSIPSGVLVTGTNTISIQVISGNSDSAYLSPTIVYDAIALYKA